MLKNLLTDLPDARQGEIFQELLRSDRVRLERIVSQGQTSAPHDWYDQDEHEWVLVLEGAGTVRFDNGEQHPLQRGDCLHIPAHTRHQVTWTDPHAPTVWLALFYR